MEKIKKFLKNNYILIIISLLIFGVIFYASNNAGYISDDYPYSLFYRGTQRITNIIQIIKNQVADYRTISARIFTNGFGQFLLMFPRWGFSIFNALAIILNVALTYLIIKEYNLNNKIHKIIYLLIFSLFLITDSTKYLVYWVMGSANYVFTIPLILLFILFIKKWGLFKHPIITGLYIGLISSFHESLLIFFIIYIFGNILYDLIKKEKFNKWYIFYITMIIFAFAFLMVLPFNRMSSNTDWNQMSLIQKLTTSIPVVSKNMFGPNHYHNLIPLIFTIAVSCTLYKKDKIANLLIISNFLVYILAWIMDDGWLYLIFSIILFVSESYMHIKNKNEKLILTSLSFYAIVYSMIITPEYAAGRPNFFMYWYMILIICLLLNNITNDKNKIISILLIIIFSVITVSREIYIYHEIGQITATRNLSIQLAKSNNLGFVAIKKIPDKYAGYQMDANALCDEYWAKMHFLHYYELNEDTYIIPVD